MKQTRGGKNRFTQKKLVPISVMLASYKPENGPIISVPILWFRTVSCARNVYLQLRRDRNHGGHSGAVPANFCAPQTFLFPTVFLVSPNLFFLCHPKILSPQFFVVTQAFCASLNFLCTSIFCAPQFFVHFNFLCTSIFCALQFFVHFNFLCASIFCAPLNCFASPQIFLCPKNFVVPRKNF